MMNPREQCESIADMARRDLEMLGWRFRVGVIEAAGEAAKDFVADPTEVKERIKDVLRRHAIEPGWDGSIA